MKQTTKKHEQIPYESKHGKHEPITYEAKHKTHETITQKPKHKKWQKSDFGDACIWELLCQLKMQREQSLCYIGFRTKALDCSCKFRIKYKQGKSKN